MRDIKSLNIAKMKSQWSKEIWNSWGCFNS